MVMGNMKGQVQEEREKRDAVWGKNINDPPHARKEKTKKRGNEIFRWRKIDWDSRREYDLLHRRSVVADEKRRWHRTGFGFLPRIQEVYCSRRSSRRRLVLLVILFVGIFGDVQDFCFEQKKKRWRCSSAASRKTPFFLSWLLERCDRIKRVRVCVMCARVNLDERVLSLFFLWNFERKDYFFLRARELVWAADSLIFFRVQNENNARFKNFLRNILQMQLH